MTESEVKTRLAAGEDSLDLAIEKWVDIREGRGEDLGRDNCALCIAYRCSHCPAALATDYTSCNGTPYRTWYNHRKAEHESVFGSCECPTCEEIADEEIAFLKSLKEVTP